MFWHIFIAYFERNFLQHSHYNVVFFSDFFFAVVRRCTLESTASTRILATPETENPVRTEARA